MKTQLDKWDKQVILYCKHWFKNATNDKIADLKKILSHRNGYPAEHINNGDVLGYLFSNIIESFVAQNYPRFLWKLVEDSSPQNSWRTGYDGGLRFNGEAGKIPYDYPEAVIYNLISLIANSEGKYFDCEFDKVDQSLLENPIN